MTAALTIHRRMQRFGIWFAWAPCAVSARQLLNLEAWSSTHCHVLQSWNFQERAQMTKQTATRIKGNIRRFVIGESTLLGCVQTNVITVSEKISPRASLWPRGLDADRVIVKFPVWFWVWTFVACLTLFYLPMRTVRFNAVTVHERQSAKKFQRRGWIEDHFIPQRIAVMGPECYEASTVASVNIIQIESVFEGSRLKNKEAKYLPHAVPSQSHLLNNRWGQWPMSPLLSLSLTIIILIIGKLLDS